MYVDFKIGTSSLEQFSFMEMTDIEYSIFKELFYQHMKNLVDESPHYSKPAIAIAKEFEIADKEISHFETLISSKEL